MAFVVSSAKHTGAAAVAEFFCRSLRSAGIHAELIFVGGRNLARRLHGEAWAHPALVKERSPIAVVTNLRLLRGLARRVDLVISHLPHDHLLCTMAGVHRISVLARNFRNRRHLRRDPLHRLIHGTVAGAMLAHSDLEEPLRRALPVARAALPSLAIPVPVEKRFTPGTDTGEWRRKLGIPPSAPVLGMVGKIAAGRGFNLLIRTSARCTAAPHVLAVGVGGARSGLEALAAELGVSDRVHWAGYQDEALPELYAAMNVVLFAAAGSDHGHRAISEAQACGRPVVAAALPGVSDLIDDRLTGRIVDADTGELATAVDELLAVPEVGRLLAEQALRQMPNRRFEAVGSALSSFLASLR